MADLKPGWTVVGNDGRRVGAVREVGQNYVLTSTGLASDIYVPASAIANVEHEVVHLSVPQRVVSEMGWQQPPRDDDAPQPLRRTYTGTSDRATSAPSLGSTGRTFRGEPSIYRDRYVPD